MKKYSFHAHLGLSVHEFTEIGQYVRIFDTTYKSWLLYTQDNFPREKLIWFGYVIHERDMEI